MKENVVRYIVEKLINEDIKFKLFENRIIITEVKNRIVVTTPTSERMFELTSFRWEDWFDDEHNLIQNYYDIETAEIEPTYNIAIIEGYELDENPKLDMKFGYEALLVGEVEDLEFEIQRGAD